MLKKALVQIKCQHGVARISFRIEGKIVTAEGSETGANSVTIQKDEKIVV